ncbi:MAG: secretin and TonB N-terminal domain-containing protein [Acidobacteriota bacterium]
MRRPAARRLPAVLLLAFALTGPALALPRRSAARPPRPRATPVPLSAGELISVDLKDADIRDVLKSFAEMAKVHLVVDPDVKGSVTVSLHDVTWVDALEVILRSNGLGMVASGRVLRVGSPARLSGEEAR